MEEWIEGITRFKVDCHVGMAKLCPGEGNFCVKIRRVECRALKDENIEKCLKVAVLGGGVILGTKTKRFQKDTYWKEMPMLGNVTSAV